MTGCLCAELGTGTRNGTNPSAVSLDMLLSLDQKTDQLTAFAAQVAVFFISFIDKLRYKIMIVLHLPEKYRKGHGRIIPEKQSAAKHACSMSVAVGKWMDPQELII